MLNKYILNKNFNKIVLYKNNFHRRSESQPLFTRDSAETHLPYDEFTKTSRKTNL